MSIPFSPLGSKDPPRSQAMHNMGGVDRFSDLPDELIHQILSCLEIKDIACIGILSKKFRQLCTSIPFLRIASKVVEAGSLVKRQGFVYFLDRFMNSRIDVQDFHLNWVFLEEHSNLEEEEVRVDAWICNAVRCNVKRIELNVHLTSKMKGFALPICFSTCGSLTYLGLDLNCGTLKLPSAGFPMVQILLLSSVGIMDPRFGEWLSFHCKSLRRLYLVNVLGIQSLNITSSSLQFLTIAGWTRDGLCHINVSAEKLQSMRVGCFSISSTGKSLCISAPNLRLFEFKGPTYHCRVNFTQVRIATIFFNSPQFRIRQAGIHPCLFEVVPHISQAEVLTLGGQLIRSLFAQGFPPVALNHLRSLVLNVILEDDLVPSIASFLDGLPKLEALSIKTDGKSTTLKANASGFDAEYWESQDQVFVQTLKWAEIELHDGENEIQLVKYLLKHGEELKKITIFCSSLDMISERIQEFKRAFSASAEVHLQLK